VIDFAEVRAVALVVVVVVVLVVVVLVVVLVVLALLALLAQLMPLALLVLVVLLLTGRTAEVLHHHVLVPGRVVMDHRAGRADQAAGQHRDDEDRRRGPARGLPQVALGHGGARYAPPLLLLLWCRRRCCCLY